MQKLLKKRLQKNTENVEETREDAEVDLSCQIIQEMLKARPTHLISCRLSQKIIPMKNSMNSPDMYENTLSEIEEKEIVTGIVVSVDDKYVIVDIGFKSEGMVPVNEFSNKVLDNLQPGDEVNVFLDRVEDREGQLILSRRKADILQAWENLEEAYETGEVIEGHIKRRIKGGMVVDVFGIDAFLPGSQIDVRPVRDFDAYVDRTMEFQVVKLNMQAENVVISHRALIESDLEEQREEILETIEAGQVLEGYRQKHYRLWCLY